MIQRLSQLWQHHRATLVAFAVAVSVLVFFGVRMVTATLYWMDPAHRDQGLEEWMTPRYVAMSYDIPPHVAGPALFLDPKSPIKRQTLQDIAAQNGVTLDALQSRIDAAVQSHRNGRP